MNILTPKLQRELDNRLTDGRLLDPPSQAMLKNMVDFGTNDSLSLSSSGALTQEFLHELAKNPGFTIGSTASRCWEGSAQYLLQLEDDLARFHGAEAGMFFNSGYDANVALWSTIPRPGDFIVCDEYVHASIHDGMRRGRAKTLQFLHNDCDSFRHCLEHVRKQNPGVLEGKQVVFISLESFYSMDGDAAPANELIDIARKELPLSNFLFVIDEAHSNGLVGPNGSGFVCHYGLEKEFPIRLNTCGKALGSAGAILLCNKTIKSTLLNYARSVIFTTAPSFVTAAAVRAGYNILASTDGERRRQRLQRNIYHFYGRLTSHPKWKDAEQRGILRLPAGNSWESVPFLSPIIPIVTFPREVNSLWKSLQNAKCWVNTVHYPIVPRKMDRIRIVVHANHTEEQIDKIVQSIVDWAAELPSRRARGELAINSVL